MAEDRMERRYFSRDEYERRWSAVQAELERRGHEIAVIWGRSAGSHDHCGDVLYLANHYANSAGLDSELYRARSFAAVIMRVGKPPELHTDEPEPRFDILATDDVSWHYDPIAGVARALNDAGVRGRVAIVGTNFLPVKYMRELEAACPAVEWVAEDDLVQRVRRIKSAEEHEAYRIAGATVSEGLTRLMEGLVMGKTEAEAAADASYAVVRAGGRIQIVATNHGDTMGYLTRNPLTGYSQSAPKPGDMVHGAIHGPMFEGYYLDPARTAVAGGRPTPEQRRLVEACADIVSAVMDVSRPGVSLLDAAALGDRMTEEFGGDADPLTTTFPFFGHGVGLFFELPRIGTTLSSKDDVFKAGMVFGVEAFLAKDGVGSAAVEQNFIIHADRNELLTTSPVLWW
jgi:Xaa-Pro dipeptidase